MVVDPDTWSARRQRAEVELGDYVAELGALLEQLDAARTARDLAAVRLIRAGLREVIAAATDELDEVQRLVDLVMHPMFAADGSLAADG